METRRASHRRSRTASGDEVQLWRRAVADVAPIRRGDGATSPADAAAPDEGARAQEHAPPVINTPSAGAPAPRPINQFVNPFAGQSVGRSVAGAAAPQTARPLPYLTAGVATDIDKRTLMRLRRGLIPPESEVDLHSCTQEGARVLLQTVLAASQSAGRRCVLVITGKGYRSGGAVGVLKAMVPRWLNEAPNRERVLAFCHARATHGGDGALYVLLRRLRAP
jgi:DNA-nicking Smr family endonuclease